MFQLKFQTPELAFFRLHGEVLSRESLFRLRAV
jgi:hypothetical protein